MKTKRLSVPTVAMLLLTVPALSSYTKAADEIASPIRGSDKTNCQSVHAVIEKQVVMDCPSGHVFDFCFTREVVDRADVITGTLEYFANPSKTTKLEHTPHQDQYNATINIVTKSGVLQIEENGIWDSTTKDWAGLSTISGGTGDFEGATGKLATLGNGDGGGVVIGTICE